jgi:hypothetical protein
VSGNFLEIRKEEGNKTTGTMKVVLAAEMEER